MTAAFTIAVAVVAYVLVGYPAAAALLARVRPRPVARDPAHEPTVSLVVLAYDEEATIEARLANIATLDYPSERLEVVVVADGSTDATAELARRAPGTVVLHDPVRAGKLAAMQRGAAVARGEVLVFSDANNRYVPDALRHLVSPLADPSVGMVTGRKAIDDGTGRPLDRAEGLYWRYEALVRSWEDRRGSVTGVCGEILAFRRDAWPHVEPGTLNEDLVQALLVVTAGWRVAYAHGAVSLERASATTADEATRRTRLVNGRLQALALLPRLGRRRPALAWRVVSHKGMRPLVAPAVVIAAIANAGLVRRRGWARATAWSQVAFYALACVGWHDERTGGATRGAGIRRALTYVPYWFCRMNLASLSGMRLFATGRREHVWARVDRG